MAEVFLVGDRGYKRMSRPIEIGPRAVTKEPFVLNLFRRLWRLWVLNGHRDDPRGSAPVCRMPELGLWQSLSCQGSENAGTERQICGNSGGILVRQRIDGTSSSALRSRRKANVLEGGADQ